MEITLTGNEVKVLKQITSTKYAVDTPLVDLDHVASLTNLSYAQVAEAMKGLHNSPYGILKCLNKNGHEINVILTKRSYEVARLFKD